MGNPLASQDQNEGLQPRCGEWLYILLEHILLKWYIQSP